MTTRAPAPPRNGTAAPAAASVLTQPVSTGEGVDRRRPAPRLTRGRVIAGFIALAILAALAWAVWSTGDARTLRANAAHLRIATVEAGLFQESVQLTGTIQPLHTVVLDAVAGGQVVRRHVAAGDTVSAGDILFTLRNDDLALAVMSSEAQLEEQGAAIRQHRLQMDAAALDLEQQVAQLDYDITRLERDEARLAGLVENGAAARKDLMATRDELAYARRRRALTARGQQQQADQREAQLRDMSASVGRLRENLSLVRRSSSNLVVRAPIAGQVSAVEAEVGELKGRGDRLGQIDGLDDVMVQAYVDEHHLARVAPGQQATATLAGEVHSLTVRSVSPEVRSGRFAIELAFDGPPPADVRRGQSARVRLALGDAEPAMLLARGAFSDATGGRWAYVLAADGQSAVRRPIELGRRAPEAFEVIGGLAPGDRVVVSGYDAFGEADRLLLD